MATEQEILK